jgi:outer membrane protein OmpA-like peptidoglycan-associated protein
MANRPINKPDETAELKRLLFAPELELLDRVHDRTAALHHRVGNDPALTVSVQRVLVDVLRQSGVQDHNSVAAALAPLIMDTVQREIRSSRAVMVDAVHPDAGRLLRTGIAQGARGATDALARPFDSVLSPTLWSARFAAWTGGQRVNDVLRERARTFRIDRILLLHRPTGLPISDSAEVADFESNDSKLLIKAANEAVRQTLSGQAEGVIQDIITDAGLIHVAASVTAITVFTAIGNPPENLNARLASSHQTLLSHWRDDIREFDGAAPSSIQPRLAQDLAFAAEDVDGRDTATFPKRRPVAGLIVISLIGLFLLGCLGFKGYQGWTATQVETSAKQTMATSPWRGYPLNFEFDPATADLRVSGLGPPSSGRKQLQAILSPLKGVETVTIDTAPLATNSGSGELVPRLAALEAAQQQQTGSGVGPVSRISLWLVQHPIHFNGNRLADPRIANARLDAVAQVIKSWNLKLSLVIAGYSDPSNRRSARASHARANTIREELIRRGVPKNRLIALGRGAEKPTAAVGSSANNRVEFEIAWR